MEMITISDMFESAILPFLLGILVAMVVGSILVLFRYGNGVGEERPDPRVVEIIKRLGKHGDTNSALSFAALMGILCGPERPETEALYQAVIATSPAFTN